MNKAQVMLSKYVNVLNEVVTTTEETGERMSPFYEAIKEGLDKNDLSVLTVEDYKKTVSTFNEGVAIYAALSEKLETVRPPARAMGMHTKLKVAYTDFYDACKMMTNSIDSEKQTIDTDAFSESETQQDLASAAITNWVQKISQTLM